MERVESGSRVAAESWSACSTWVRGSCGVAVESYITMSHKKRIKTRKEIKVVVRR